MNERVIKIEKIDPKDLFGPQNKNIKFIKLKFPELKIVARGDKIKAYGNKEDLNDFEERINKIINYFIEYNIISDNEIEMLLNNSSADMLTSKISHKPILHGVNGRVIKAKSLNQRRVVDAVFSSNMVFAIGPAGTGKTYTGIALAVRALKQKEVKRIILTRPALEAGENLGFLPGDLKEKLDPYMLPLYDALKDMIPSDKLKKYIEDETIQIAPLAFMRGRTLDNAFVILDEGQNTTHSQMKMFLTRMGKNAKFLITADPGQIDLPSRITSGIKEALLILKETDGIEIVRLNDGDIIRNILVKKIIDAYKNIENTNQG
ncbi:MAG: PhoH family protein [Flavobacteriaceae bacterium]|nr:PhoH family protein [Flavobacteriaceae bacterium]